MPGGFTLHSGSSETPTVWRDQSGLTLRDGLAWEAVGVAQHVSDGLTESPIHPLDETLSILRTLDEVRRQITTGPAS